MSEASKNLVKVLRNSGMVTDPVLSKVINNAVSKSWTSLSTEELREVHRVLEKVDKFLTTDPALSKAINNAVSKVWTTLSPKELQEADEVLDRIVKILVPNPAPYKPTNKMTSKPEKRTAPKTTAIKTKRAIPPETPKEAAWHKAIQAVNKSNKLLLAKAIAKAKPVKTAPAPKLRFERRHTSIPIRRRELVHFQTKNVPELQERLDRMEIGLITTIGEKDPILYEFLEWFSEECRLFGLRIRPGLAALYWSWADKELEAQVITQKCEHPENEASCIRFSREKYYLNATELGRSIRYGSYDNILYTGVFLLTQFIWWSAGEILYRDYLTSAVCEFIEYKEHGRMPDWLKRRRRRLASSQRRAVKEALSNMVSALDDNEE